MGAARTITITRFSCDMCGKEADTEDKAPWGWITPIFPEQSVYYRHYPTALTSGDSKSGYTPFIEGGLYFCSLKCFMKYVNWRIETFTNYVQSN